VAGEEYRLHCRIDKSGVEEVYLDENELATTTFADASSFRVGSLKHSPDCSLIAFGVDATGNERYTTQFMDICTKKVLPDCIEDVYTDLEFANDCRTVYYTVLDECERAYKLKRHRIGTDVATDEVVYHETDEQFFLTLSKTCNGKYILLSSAAQITTEHRYIAADDPAGTLHLLIPRRENIQNRRCESHGSHFYVLTNEDSKNNWLFRVPVPVADGAASWDDLVALRETVIDHRDFVLIEDFEVRRGHLIVFERSNCLQNVRIVDLAPDSYGAYHYVRFSESVYSLWPGSVDEEVADLTRTAQFDTNILRFTYTSFVQPKQVVDYDMDTRLMAVVHEERVGVPYDMDMYVSRRLYATGEDGTVVPVSIVYRRDLLGQAMCPPRPNPVLLHAYGAYGAFLLTIFSTSRLSLLDRGFIFAAAHVRGGADMGNAWYEEGKLAKKTNTFLDFCAVAEHLIKEEYTTPEHLSIYGRSAGGLLIGAVINMRPELFRAALTEVPFVDVLNTMFDPTIPWTAFEYEEWGNPIDREIYEVMKTYCPYTNIDGSRDYPHLLVVGGMNDPRVAFFEPLKFVAKLRGERRRWRQKNRPSPASKTKTASTISLTTRAAEDRMILLRVDDAGHGGSAGNYAALEDLAFEYAFLISALDAPARPIPISGSTDPSQSMVGARSGSWGNVVGSPLLWHPEGVQSSDALDGSVERKRSRKKRAGEGQTPSIKGRGDRSQNRMFQWVANFF
ncbi:prolyl oligopeptidase family-domain-containing protein, partial [Blyttiomyces helicus]